MKELMRKVWCLIVALVISMSIIFGAYGQDQMRVQSRESTSRVRREVDLEN